MRPLVFAALERMGSCIFLAALDGHTRIKLRPFGLVAQR